MREEQYSTDLKFATESLQGVRPKPQRGGSRSLPERVPGTAAEEMTEIRLSHPLLLWVGLLPVLIVLFQMIGSSRRTARLRLSSYPWLPEAGREPVRWLLAARFARLCAMVCLAVLLAGFVAWKHEETFA
jgi:hypothetical protein